MAEAREHNEDVLRVLILLKHPTTEGASYK